MGGTMKLVRGSVLQLDGQAVPRCKTYIYMTLLSVSLAPRIWLSGMGQDWKKWQISQYFLTRMCQVWNTQYVDAGYISKLGCAEHVVQISQVTCIQQQLVLIGVQVSRIQANDKQG